MESKKMMLFFNITLVLLLALSFAIAEENQTNNDNPLNNMETNYTNNETTNNETEINDTTPTIPPSHKITHGQCVSNLTREKKLCYRFAQQNYKACEKSIRDLRRNLENNQTTNNQSIDNETANNQTTNNTENEIDDLLNNLKTECRNNYKARLSSCKTDFKQGKKLCEQFKCKDDEIFSFSDYKCKKICSKNQVYINNTCVKKCRSNQVLINDVCMKKCKDNEVLTNNNCEKRCRSNEVLINNTCVRMKNKQG